MIYSLPQCFQKNKPERLLIKGRGCCLCLTKESSSLVCQAVITEQTEKESERGKKDEEVTDSVLHISQGLTTTAWPVAKPPRWTLSMVSWKLSATVLLIVFLCESMEDTIVL